MSEGGLGSFGVTIKVGDADLKKLQQELKNSESLATRVATNISSALGGAGAKSGQDFGDGFSRGADGKLRDARGKLVAQSSEGFGNAGKKAGTEFGGAFGGALKGVMTGILQGVGQQITSMVAGTAGDALKSLGNRDAYMKMDGAKAGLRSLGADTEKLEQLAKGATKELKNLASTREILQSSYEIVSSGFQGEDAIKIATTAKKASVSAPDQTGAAADPGVVGDAMTSVMNAYKVGADQADKVASQMIGTVNAGKISMAEYASMIGQVASVAAESRVPLHELNAVIAAATVAGVPVSSTMSGIKAAIAAIAKPTDDAAKLAKSMGLEFNSAALKSKGLVGVMRDIDAAGLATSDGIYKLFGSTEAWTALQPVFGRINTDFQDIQNTVTGVDLNTAFEQGSQSAARMQDRMAALKEELALKTQTALAPMFEAGNFALSTLLQSMNEGGVLFTALNTAAMQFRDYLAQNPQVLQAMVTGFQQLAQGGVDLLVLGIQSMTEALRENPQLIQELVTNLAQAVQAGAEFSMGFGQGLQTVGEFLAPIAELVSSLMEASGSSDSLATNLGKAAAYVAVFATGASVFSTIASVVTTIGGVLGAMAPVIGFITTTVLSIVNTVSMWATGTAAVASAMNPIGLILAAIGVWTYNIIQYTSKWGDVVLGVKQTIKDANNVCLSVIRSVLGIVGQSQHAEKVWGMIKQAIFAVINPLGNIYNAIDSTIKKTGIFRSQWEGIKNFFGTVANTINSLCGGALDGLIQKAQSFWETLKGIAGMGGGNGGSGATGESQLEGSISGQLDGSGQNGADMPTGPNGEMKSYHNGTVTELGTAGNNGNYVVVSYMDELGNQLEATYSHIGAIVKKGDQVVGGQVLGNFDASGRTFGAHNSIDINTPGTNGALQRSQESAAAKRGADILVTGKVQGTGGGNSAGGGGGQGAVDDWIQALMYLKEGEGTNIALENRAAGNYGGYGTSLAKQALAGTSANPQFAAFEGYQGTSQFDTVEGVKQAAAKYGISEAQMIAAGNKAKQNYSRDRGVIGNRTSFRTAGSFDGTNMTPHAGNWYLNEETWDGVDRRPSGGSGGGMATPFYSQPSYKPAAQPSYTQPKVTPQQAQKHIVIPLDHTRRQIPDKTGGNTYKASGQTGAAYGGYTERDFQDPLAAKAKTQLESQGYKVSVMKPEDYPSFEAYDAQIAQHASKGAVVTPLHFDAKGGSYLTRSKGGDTADSRLSHSINSGMQKSLGASASSQWKGPDTEANMTVNAAGNAPATLVEFGAMSDMIDRYKNPKGYMQSQEANKALSGYMSGLNSFTGGGGQKGGITTDDDQTVADNLARENKAQQDAVEAARKGEDDRTRIKREEQKRSLTQAREAQKLKLQKVLATTTTTGAKEGIERNLKTYDMESQYGDRKLDFQQKRDDLKSAKDRKVIDLKSKDPEVIAKAKTLPDYSAQIKAYDLLIAKEQELHDAALGNATLADQTADSEQTRLSKRVQAKDAEEDFGSTLLINLNLEKDRAALTNPALALELDRKIQIIEANRALNKELVEQINKQEELTTAVEEMKAAEKQTGIKITDGEDFKRTISELTAVNDLITGIKERGKIKIDIITEKSDQAKTELGLKQRDSNMSKDAFMSRSQTDAKSAIAEQMKATGNTFEATALEREVKLQQEALRYRQALLEIEKQVYDIRKSGVIVSDGEVLALQAQAGVVNQMNLRGIMEQTKGLKGELADTAKAGFGALFKDLITGSKSAGDAFKSFAEGIISKLADMATNMLISNLFGGMFGAGGGAQKGVMGSSDGGGGGFGGILNVVGGLAGSMFGGNKAYGNVPNFAKGSIDDAFAREAAQAGGGFKPQLAVVNDRELILSAKQSNRFRELGLSRMVNYAGGNLGTSPTSSMGAGNVSVNSPITINSSGETPQLDPRKLNAGIKALVQEQINDNRRQGNALSPV